MTEVLVEFALGASLNFFRQYCYERDHYQEIKKIKQLGVDRARQRAKRFLRRTADLKIGRHDYTWVG